MIWDTVKEACWRNWASASTAGGRRPTGNPCTTCPPPFYGRFAAEDMRERSVENLYGCLYGCCASCAPGPRPRPGSASSTPRSRATAGRASTRWWPSSAAASPLHRLRARRTEPAQPDHPRHRQLQPAGARDAAGELEAVLADDEGRPAACPRRRCCTSRSAATQPGGAGRTAPHPGRYPAGGRAGGDDFPAMGERLQAVEQQIRASESVSNWSCARRRRPSSAGCSCADHAATNTCSVTSTSKWPPASQASRLTWWPRGQPRPVAAPHHPRVEDLAPTWNTCRPTTCGAAS